MASSIENCDSEPIHALGLIQEHGALVAFDRDGRVVARSANAAAQLGRVPALGTAVTGRHFDPVARDAIARALNDSDLKLDALACTGGKGQLFELTLHWSNATLLAEWEAKPPDAPSTTHYAKLVERSIAQLHRGASASLEQLLAVATDAIQILTGFDRVMAYRFLPDGSGTVSAETRSAHLTPYLNLRYPAGDIPAQARQLYVLNPIRHIADVAAPPVAIEMAETRQDTPLDLSNSILRSVSPIHIEYLQNMGVAASMSVSLVVDGKLWGLIACHHTRVLSVPHAVRVSCVVLAQVLSLAVERNELSQRAHAERRIETLRGQVASALSSAQDPTAGLLAAHREISELVEADALSVLVGQRVGSFPAEFDRAAALKVADYLTVRKLDVFATDSVSRDAPELAGLRTGIGDMPGILALQLDNTLPITIVWWRAELVETVEWAGQPDRPDDAAGNGGHLRPRKSFEVWRETVRGSSRAWAATDRFAARELRAILQTVAFAHIRAAEQERATLLAIMGHDLRDPLQAINMVVTLLGRGLISSDVGAKRIEYSSRRMQSLISYILDVSRLRTGIGLTMDIRQNALTPLLEAALEHERESYPGVQMSVTIDDLGDWPTDADRLMQAMSNLLSNARHHGDLRFPIHVSARRSGNSRRIEITNRLLPDSMFQPGAMTLPLNAASARNLRNKAGLGLGLYIANAITSGLGGTLEVERVGEEARFAIVLNGGGD
ncbi:GAF domain-containing protein [Paraburkholderia sp. BCC1886]|uniref:GAF domain-containing protein n=1 Tax=Paraburkholderia sp. BCC1886 TaxID=2562670 RepID=UPI001183A929|nr:GAF domain-containing protein [Paraburkholderia sp. BCC1886]